MRMTILGVLGLIVILCTVSTAWATGTDSPARTTADPSRASCLRLLTAEQRAVFDSLSPEGQSRWAWELVRLENHLAGVTDRWHSRVVAAALGSAIGAGTGAVVMSALLAVPLGWSLLVGGAVVAGAVALAAAKDHRDSARSRDAIRAEYQRAVREIVEDEARALRRNPAPIDLLGVAAQP